MESLYNFIGTFDIKFHEQSILSFYTGDVIYGSVNLYVKKDVDVKSIYVHVRGESFVYFQEVETFSLAEDHVHIRKDHEKFWDFKINVWERDKDDKSSLLSVGHHTFPFSMNIPNTNKLPSSFESQQGAIRYWMKVAVHQHDENEISKFKPFTVLQKIDVNSKDYSHKISNEIEKTMCCSCWSPRAFHLSAFLPRTGFCPGESIPVNCRGKNKGWKLIGGLKARLIQRVKYTCGEHVKTVEKIVSAIGGNPIEKGRTKVWENQLLKVPPIPPSILNCSNIKITYRVQVTMAIPNGVDMQFHLPVTIGTLPQTNDDPLAKPIVRMHKCAQGVECFNHSSKIHNFPLQAYTPACAYVENFRFVARGLVFRESKHKRSISMTHKKKYSGLDEKKPLLRSRSTDYS